MDGKQPERLMRSGMGCVWIVVGRYRERPQHTYVQSELKDVVLIHLPRL